jgi:hypothetical protein
LATARTINRFGRTYVEFDPDGTGGGPATWILGSAGAGSGSGPTVGPSGVFTPAVTGKVCRAGNPLYFKSAGVLDLAQAIDSVPPGGVHPYQVSGLASFDANTGEQVGLITDGQLSLSDWIFIAGTTTLTVGARYYLSQAAAGMLTDSCPSAPGTTVISVGQAISPSTLEVEITFMVRL